MPTFNQYGPLSVQVSPGDTMQLFTAETLTAPATSKVYALLDSGAVERRSILFQANWATTPTASLVIYGSNTAPTTAGPQNGVALGSAITANGVYQDTAGFKFYWATLASQSAGGALTLTGHVS
jgi:hypothetical protein